MEFLTELNKYTDELINTTNKAFWQVDHAIATLNEMKALVGEEAVEKAIKKFKLAAYPLLTVSKDISEIQREAALEFGEIDK